MTTTVLGTPASCCRRAKLSRGMNSAVRSIRSLASEMPIPVAIETGVNYLQPRADEIPDGEFVARVVEAADCGILLDLHNLWTNQRNGRQSVADYGDHLPLDRVWQIHLAGGSSHRGYWIDAHSGAVPAELLDLATRIVPRLPNLKAIVFELSPAYLSNVGFAMFRAQLEALHRLWDRRGSNAKNAPRNRTDVLLRIRRPLRRSGGDAGFAHVHKPCTSPFATELRRDAGLSIIREMVEQLRGSMIVRTLRLSSRLIMLERGTGCTSKSSWQSSGEIIRLIRSRSTKPRPSPPSCANAGPTCHFSRKSSNTIAPSSTSP